MDCTNLKKITLAIVAYEEEADAIQKMMANNLLAQCGIYTIQCGEIAELTEEEINEIKMCCDFDEEEEY